MARIISAFTQFFDDAGNPLVDGQLKFVESGTNNTDKDTFKDSNMTVPNTNPVLLDGAGRCPNVFGTGVYNVISFTAVGQQIQQFDPVGANSTGSSFDYWAATDTYAKGDIVRGSNNEYYRSLINGNQNNNPTSSTASWEELELGRIYNASVTYSKGESAYATNGILHYSLVDSNIGNTPQTSPSNWYPSNLPFFAEATGTADAIAADFPINVAFIDGAEVRVRALGANTIATPTFSQDGDTARTIVKDGNQSLDIGNIFGSGHDLILRANSSNNNWELLNPSPKQESVLRTDDLLHVTDLRAAGVNGGTFTAGAWQIRPLANIVTNTIDGAGLTGSGIEIPAGDYFIELFALSNQVNQNIARLQQVLPSPLTLGTSSSGYSNSGVTGNNRVTFSGVLSFGATATLQLQHWCVNTIAGTGFGVASNVGEPELYAEIKIWKVA